MVVIWDEFTTNAVKFNDLKQFVKIKHEFDFSWDNG